MKGMSLRITFFKCIYPCGHLACSVHPAQIGLFTHEKLYQFQRGFFNPWMPASMVPNDEVSTSRPGNMGKAGNPKVFLNDGVLFHSDNIICDIDITQQTGYASFYEQIASLQTRKI